MPNKWANQVQQQMQEENQNIENYPPPQEFAPPGRGRGQPRKVVAAPEPQEQFAPATGQTQASKHDP